MYPIHPSAPAARQPSPLDGEATSVYNYVSILFLIEYMMHCFVVQRSLSVFC